MGILCDKFPIIHISSFMNMKTVVIICYIVFLMHFKAAEAKVYDGSRRCVNMWDEGCINGQLPGAGGDDDYLNGGFNPGKRCLNVWDEDCAEGKSKDADRDGNNGRFLPGSRSLYDLLLKLQRKQQL